MLCTQPHYDVGILVTVALVVLAIVMIFALRFRCRSNRTWVRKDSTHYTRSGPEEQQSCRVLLQTS